MILQTAAFNRYSTQHPMSWEELQQRAQELGIDLAQPLANAPPPTTQPQPYAAAMQAEAELAAKAPQEIKDALTKDAPRATRPKARAKAAADKSEDSATPAADKIITLDPPEEVTAIGD